MEKHSDPSITPANTDTTATGKTKTRKEKRLNNNSQFNNDFLIDFRLIQSNRTELKGKYWRSTTDWVYSQKALDRFHQPVTFKNPNPNGSEGPKHYGLKQLVHDYIYENYYLENECKFLVTTELEQKNSPFYSYMDGKIPVYFTLDVCVIRESDHQVFDIEIDGPEHYTKKGMMKADIRDEWLKDRYGVLTYRIDEADDEPNYKKIDKFISQPAVKNPRKKIIRNRKSNDPDLDS